MTLLSKEQTQVKISKLKVQGCQMLISLPLVKANKLGYRWASLSKVSKHMIYLLSESFSSNKRYKPGTQMCEQRRKTDMKRVTYPTKKLKAAKTFLTHVSCDTAQRNTFCFECIHIGRLFKSKYTDASFKVCKIIQFSTFKVGQGHQGT